MSRSRKRPERTTLANAARPAPSDRQTRAATRGWVAKAGRVMVVLGGVLFVLGNIGARTGWVTLPFDPHHFYAQFGGAALLLIGVTVAGRR